MLEIIQNYFNEHIAFLLFLCLGLGYIVGKIRIKNFVLGATAGTLLVGIVISQFVSVDIQGVVKTIFFSLFCFTIGFDVGPSFFSSLRSSGVKIVILSVFFTVFSILTAWLICIGFGLDEGYGTGLIAGALTQTSVIGAAQLSGELNQNATITYGLTYVFGTIGVILFVKNIAPLMLRKSLQQIVKNKVDSSASITAPSDDIASDIMQVRAYMIAPDSAYCNITISKFEKLCNDRVEVEALFRGGRFVSSGDEDVLLSGDVIQVIGDINALNAADNCGLNEVTDSKYYKVKITEAKIVLTDDFTENGAEILSEKGILIKNKDRKKPLMKNTVITVAGTEKAIKKAAKVMGYIKDEGNTTDIAFMSIAVAAGLFIGTLAFKLGVISLSLGESVGVLLSGLICGWWYERSPRIGRIPSATRVFLKSLGLNFYIGVLALSVGDKFFEAMSSNGWLLIGLGVIMTLVPHTVSLLFGKYIMKIDDADLLGGLCGCGTCTAALNSLSDETNSSVFALGYAPGCAVGNILLTLAGIILPLLLK